MELTGRVAIVTGASRGIGRAIALELGRAGARVVVNYHRDAAAAEAVAAELEHARVVQADVATQEGVDRLIAAAEDWGELDIVVNNAGITRDAIALRMRDEDWNDVMRTNLDGTFRMCRAALGVMFRRRRGAIVNVVSVSALRGNPGQSNYAASKAAIVGMTRSMAKEMAKRNIRLNCVAPGFVETDMVADVDPRVVEGAKKAIPMRRLGTPEDVAPAVRFLVGPGAGYITGQVLVIDGGLSS